jgi:hypothetical protein
MTFDKKYGTRAEVMHGVAEMTTGRRRKSYFFKNKHGEIVSKKLSLLAKKEKRLEKAGYFTRKGVFGAFKKDSKSKSKSAKKGKTRRKL